MDAVLGPSSLEALRSVSLGAFAVVFAAGVAMGLVPSSYALYPVIAGFVAGDEDHSARRGLVLSGAFVAGTATVDAAVGALFGVLGGIVIEALARYVVLWNLIVAAVLAVLGLALLRVLVVRWPVLRMNWRRAHTVPGAYALGIPFGLTACPACTPMVLPILGAAAATGSWWFGAALMFAFGLARGLPLLLVGSGTGVLGRLRVASGWVPKLERAGGVVLLLAAVFFLGNALRTAWSSWV